MRRYRFLPRAIALAPDGHTLAVLSGRGSILLQNINRLPTYPSHRVLPVLVSQAIFTPDSRAIVAAERDGGISQWDLESLREKRRWLHGTAIQPLGLPARTVISPDVTKAASLNDGGVTIRDLASGMANSVPGDEPFNELRFTENGRYLLALRYPLIADDFAAHATRGSLWKSPQSQ